MVKIIKYSFFLFLFFFSSCDKDVSPQGKLVFKIYPTVSNEQLELNQRTYINQAGNVYEVTNLKYLLSDFTVQSESSVIITEGAHYFDIQQNGETHYIQIEEDFLTGDYKFTSFVFGLDSNKNTANNYINEPFHLNFTWPDNLGGGYHYMQMDGFYDHTDGSTHSFLTHRGRALDNITGEPKESFTLIEFDDVSFTIEANQTTTIELYMDLNNFYQMPHIYNFEDYSGIMGDSEAQQVLHENEQDVFGIKSILD